MKDSLCVVLIEQQVGEVLMTTEIFLLKDFMLANRRAARMEDIAAHGKTQCAGSTPGVGV